MIHGQNISSTSGELAVVAAQKFFEISASDLGSSGRKGLGENASTMG
jgi:hypothetical protein